MLTRVERRSSGPTCDSGEGGATGSETGGSYAGDRTGDESSGEVADVEESSTSSSLSFVIDQTVTNSMACVWAITYLPCSL